MQKENYQKSMGSFLRGFSVLDNLSMSAVMPRSLLCVKNAPFLTCVSSRESTPLLLLNEPLPVYMFVKHLLL